MTVSGGTYNSGNNNAFWSSQKEDLIFKGGTVNGEKCQRNNTITILL